MKLKISIPLILSLLLGCTTTRNSKDEKITTRRPSVKCMENSPERRGEEGCTILTDRPLVGSLTKTVYWHIDRFESLEAAIKAAGPSRQEQWIELSKTNNIPDLMLTNKFRPA